jgi:hypothetical protein
MNSDGERKALEVEYTQALEKKNYLRALSIGRLLKKPEEELRGLQEKTIRQLVIEHRNAEGLEAFLQEYPYPRDALDSLFQSILRESSQVDGSGRNLLKNQFDTGTLRFLSLEEWIRRYFGRSP